MQVAQRCHLRIGLEMTTGINPVAKRESATGGAADENIGKIVELARGAEDHFCSGGRSSVILNMHFHAANCVDLGLEIDFGPTLDCVCRHVGKVEVLNTLRHSNADASQSFLVFGRKRAAQGAQI